MRVKLYAVTSNKPTFEECLNNMITIVKNVKQADEYIYNMIFIENSQHFTMWCELHEKDAKDKKVFYDYLMKVYPDESPFTKYLIIPLKYTKDNLCALLRMLSGSVPVGASYETVQEQEAFLTRVAQNVNEKDC